MNIFDFCPQLIVYDFDGVMTDNRALLDENGKEAVFIHRGDGYGVRMIKDKLKIPQLILSTEENPIVAFRAKKLGIPVIYNAGDTKRQMLEKYCLNNGYDIKKTMYIGNDLNDAEVMSACGYRGCPSDSEPEILLMSDFRFSARGGYGVVRELYRILTEGKNEQGYT